MGRRLVGAVALLLALPVGVLVPMGAGLALAADEVTTDGGLGMGDDCGGNPVACYGATPLNEYYGYTGGVVGEPACLGGRIVDGESDSDAIPYCPDVDGDGVADLPAPPSHAQIVAQLCPSPPAPVVGLAPPNRGITGLETLFWSDPQQPLSAAGMVGHYQVFCTLVPHAWTFDPADPEWGGDPVTVSAPGSRDDPAHRYMWEVKDTYPVSVTVTWKRVTAAGVDSTTSTTTHDYGVNEIVTVPADPDS